MDNWKKNETINEAIERARKEGFLEGVKMMFKYLRPFDQVAPLPK